MNQTPCLSAQDTVRARAWVDPAAVAHNLAAIRRQVAHAGARPRVWATAKADAYGHGLARVLPGLTQADGIAVQQLAEAHACRQAGWQGPIIVYNGLLGPADSHRLPLADLHLVISHTAQLDWLATCPPDTPAPWLWLRFNGDIRLAGFEPAEYLAAYARCAALAAHGRIRGIGHLTHFARAEDEDGIAGAAARFHQLVGHLPGPVSTSNSATIWRHGSHASSTDWIRPGLTLYGASPLPGHLGADLGLRPAMTLQSQLIGTQTLAAGDSAGYQRAFVASAPTRIGLVACGYADGYPRHAPAGTPIVVAGRRTRLLGRVTMDLLLVDLGPVPEAGIGAPVTLWGTPDLPIEEVAAAMGTIAAELMTCLTARVPVVAGTAP